MPCAFPAVGQQHQVLEAGAFTVEDADGQARVVWECSFVALDPAMAANLAEMWEPYLPMVLANLKKLVENR